MYTVQCTVYTQRLHYYPVNGMRVWNNGLRAWTMTEWQHSDTGRDTDRDTEVRPTTILQRHLVTLSRLTVTLHHSVIVRRIRLICVINTV